MTVKRAAASGIKWTSLAQFGNQVMQITTTALLTRLLMPADFGIVGMATVVIGFLGLFKDLGTSSALVQRKELMDELVSTIFWTNLAFGIVTTAMLIVIAPVIAALYREPNLTAVLQVLALSFSISSLSIVQNALLQRALAFRQLAQVNLTATATGCVIGIGTALSGAGVWSLVYQSLAVNLVTSVLLWWASSWRPTRVARWAEFKSVSSYSLNLLGFNVFNYISRNADYFIIGLFLGKETLGYYSLAYKLMLYPLQTINQVVQQVTFPVYSQIQDDLPRFRNTYLKVTSLIATITFPMSLGLMIVADMVVLTLSGAEWKPAIPIVVILAPISLIQSIIATVGGIYQARGRTDLLFRIGIIVGLASAFSFLIGVRYGIIGIAVAYAIVTIALIYPNLAVPFRLIHLPIHNLLAALTRPFLCSLVMVAATLIAKILLPSVLPPLVVLVFLIGIGVVSYTTAAWFLNRYQVKELVLIVRGQT